MQHGYPKLFGSLPGSGKSEAPAQFLSIIYCFVFLYLFAAGGGPWSLDGKLSSRFRRRDR